MYQMMTRHITFYIYQYMDKNDQFTPYLLRKIKSE